jgi:hypothetical protein
VFALVVVIHFGITVDQCGHRFKLFRRHRHGRERAHADRVGPHHGTDAADGPGALERREPGEHLFLGRAQRTRDVGIRCRRQRKILLKIIQQAPVQII